MVVKTCPACGAAFDWPLYTESVTCPRCRQVLSLAGPAPQRSDTGRKIMLVGLALVVLAILLPILATV